MPPMFCKIEAVTWLLAQGEGIRTLRGDLEKKREKSMGGPLRGWFSFLEKKTDGRGVGKTGTPPPCKRKALEKFLFRTKDKQPDG